MSIKIFINIARSQPIVVFNLNFNILKIINLIYLIFLELSMLNITGWSNFFCEYYRYPYVKLILLIYTGFKE